MRVTRLLGDTFLDFIENTRIGSGLFKVARVGFFALLVLAASRIASHQFLALELSDILFMAITAVVFLVILWRWEIGIILMIGTTSFIAYYDIIPTLSLYHFIPEIRILEDLRLQIGQAIMLYLLALFALSLDARRARERLATPLSGAVAIFCTIIFVAALVGVVFSGVDLTKMVETSRSYSYYLMFFVTLLCVRGRRQLNILFGTLYAMAIIVAILMFVQFALGDRARVFIGGSIRVEMFGGHAGRILPPGVELIWLTTPFLIARIPLVSGFKQKLMSGTLGLLLGGILLTFTRSVWMGVLLAMFIMSILGRGEIRRGILRMFVALALFVVALLVSLKLVSTEREDYVAPYIQRFTSIFHPESYEQGSSAGARWEEISAAWPSIVSHPWLGIGVGGTYRYSEDWNDPTQEHYMRGVSYIHDAYVLLLTHTGVLGFGSCMIMFIIFFVRARRIFYLMSRPEDRAMVMAAIGAIASVLLASVMQPELWYPPAVPLIGIIFAVVELLRYFKEREARQSQETHSMVAVSQRRMQDGTVAARDLRPLRARTSP